MIHVNPPCKGCKRRKVGCHNVETCPEWKAYMERYEVQRAKAYQAYMVYPLPNPDRIKENRQRRMVDYRLRKLRGRR